MSSLQSKNSSQHHQAAFNSLKINLKYCKFQINFNCVQMGRKSVSSEIKWQVIGMARTNIYQEDRLASGDVFLTKV